MNFVRRFLSNIEIVKWKVTAIYSNMRMFTVFYNRIDWRVFGPETCHTRLIYSSIKWVTGNAKSQKFRTFFFMIRDRNIVL